MARQTICGALPLDGDGTAPCARKPFHRGLHRSRQGLRFAKIERGTSPRSPTRARRDAATRAYLGLK